MLEDDIDRKQAGLFMSKTRLIIADDHMVLREGVKAILQHMEELEVVGEAADGLELLPLLEKQKADLLILDLGMPNLGGIEAINRINKLRIKPLILVLSAREDECSVGEAINAGAKGYVPKSAAREELELAVRALLKGQTYISPVVAGILMQKGPGAQDTPLSALSSREREVMKLLSEGNPNREVAKILHISPRTIDSHRANILKKLGVHSNAELTQLAIKYGLVE